MSKVRVVVVVLPLLVGAAVLVVTGQWVTALGTAALGALAIGREVWKLWQPRIVQGIDIRVRRLLSTFDRRYREFMLGTVRFIDLKGLATVGAYHPELDEVFIDLSLAHRAPGQVSGDVLAQLPAKVTEQHSIWESLDSPEPRILAILGVPGSGKTTLLRHIVRRLCLSQRLGPRRTVPILLFLRDHVSKIVSQPDVTLLGLLRGKLGRLAADEPPEWFEQRLRNGDCVIMLDGLDEVGRLEDRARVHDWVEQQIQQYPDNDYVITARPLGYEHIEGARVLQVRAFTDDQVTRFVRSWSFVMERHAAPRTTAEDVVRQQADQQADDLLERLGGAPALYDLTVNPLLLTMIVTVHRERGALPGNRTDLYNEICQVVLWRQQENRRLNVGLDGRKKEVLLRRLAFAMMEQRVSDLPLGDVLAEFDSARSRMSIELTAPDILTDVRPHGILVRRENDLYSFAHQTFQEFLAAAHIRDMGLSTVLVDAVDDVWWRETTLLYAAMSDADPIMWACLNSGDNAALSLALDCADQCRELAPELRERIDALLASLREPDTEPGRRRDVIRAVITRHLHQMIRTGSGTAVCARPIPIAIYRLYQQDTNSHAPHTTDETDEAGRLNGSNEDDPVTGVRPREVLAFLRWVNDITDGEPGYRLPARADLDDPAVQRALTTRTLSVWTALPHGQPEPELWAPADVGHPHAVDAATLRRYVRDDLERSTPTVVRFLLLRAVVAVASLKPTRHETWSIDEDYIEEMHKALDREPSRDRRRLRHLHQELLAAHADHHNIVTELERILDAVRYLAPTIPIDHKRAGGLTAALGNDLVRNYEGLVEDIERPLARILESAIDATTNEAGALERVIPIDRHHALHIATGNAAYSRVLDQVQGAALSGALRHILRRTPTPTWSTDLSEELVTIAGVPDTEFVVLADALADRIRRGYEGMREFSGSWAAPVAAALQDIALPVTTWREPLTADSATAIRLAALCLAAEADIHGADSLRTTFHEIAAGVTFLQQRTTSDGPSTETIILATQ